MALMPGAEVQCLCRKGTGQEGLRKGDSQLPTQGAERVKKQSESGRKAGKKQSGSGRKAGDQESRYAGKPVSRIAGEQESR
jgi:hypothetical protein